MNYSLIQKINEHLQRISLEKLEKFFFALFLLSIPFQTRLTFITPQTYQNGTFNEYVTFFSYLSDILFITTLFIYFVNIINKSNDLTKNEPNPAVLLRGIGVGILRSVSAPPIPFNSPASPMLASIRSSRSGQSIGVLRRRNKNFSIKKYVLHLFHTYPRFIPTFTLFITLITWSFVNTLWSEHKNIAFYQSVKITELSLLFLYINYRLRWFGVYKFISLIFISGFFESIVGITQYYLQKSLGLKILMEPIITPEIPNVAKIVVDGEKIIRAYGTFPHPNVFSGFLILSIFCGFWLLLSCRSSKHNLFNSSVNTFIIKSFHACPPKLTCLIKCLTLAIKSKLFHVKQFRKNISTSCTHYQIVSRETIWLGFIILGIITQLTAFIFTFSRIAWIALILIITIFIFLSIKYKLFHVKQFGNFILRKTAIISILLIIIPLLTIINYNWKQIINRTNDSQNNYPQSITNRILYNNIAINIINEHPIIGIGGKNFTLQMQAYYNKPLEWWQFQPVHNIFLLIASELGIFGLILFLLPIYLIIKNTCLNTNHEIVSRLPTEADTANITEKTMQINQIVSRETISKSAKVGETILVQIGLISILIGFLFIGLFDHYFWTLQQGQLTFWLVLGAISSINILPTKN